jgi:uroporphyrinogen-III synthase
VIRAVEPVAARLGSMARAVLEELDGRSLHLALDGHRARLQGDAVVHEDTTTVALTFGEAQLLRSLLGRCPAVVSKEELAQGGDPHAVEAAVARLRTKLGALGRGIKTVPRRGYVAMFEVDRADALRTG